MKILHTADWHLGMELYRVSLLEDQRYFFQQLKQIVIEKEIDVIVVSGDIFDTMLASKDAIMLYDDMVTELCLTLHKQVIVIAGNHDSAARLANCSRLLKPMGLHVYGKIEEKIKGIEIQDCMFYPIPYFHNEQIAQVYQVPILNEEQAFSCIVQDLKEHMDEHKKQIVLAHAFVNGATPSQSDRFANIGGSDLVSKDVFEGFDYVALGHLHRMQTMDHHVYYSGSPLAYSFQEAQYEKCVLIYDTDTNDVYKEQVEALHPLKTYKGTLEELQTIQVKEHAYLRFEVTDTPISYEMLAFFRERYDHLLQLVGTNREETLDVSLAVDELETLRDEDIFVHFFKDILQEDVDDEIRALFLEACKQIEEDTYAS